MATPSVAVRSAHDAVIAIEAPIADGGAPEPCRAELPAPGGRVRGACANPDIVRRAIAYVRSDFTESVTLCDLAKVTRCSTFQIIRAFRAEVGQTPHAFIMALRIRHATKLLRAGQYIVEAAADTGFADQSHFTRHFKRVHGITPGEYVRQLTRRQP